MKDIKHQDIIESIENKEVSLRKDWEHLFILKHRFKGSVRRYLLSFGDFKEAIDDGKTVSHIVMCQSSSFNGIKCLESEKQYGFFAERDCRPSSCTWIDKEDAKKLHKLFALSEESE